MKKKKNIIIISIDNLRSDCVGGTKDIFNKYRLKNNLKTPILDGFVKKGVFFKNCISTAPYTTNAHASILTGCWPYNHGIIDFFSNKLDRPTILEILKKEGYSTLFQSDFHFLLGKNLGFDKGVDKYVKEDEKESFKWIKKNRNKPMMCFFHFANVHIPYGFVNLSCSGHYYEEKVNYLLKKYNIEPDKIANRSQHFVVSDLKEEDLILKQNYQKVLDKLYKKGEYDKIIDLYIEGINFFENFRFKKFIDNIKNMGLFEDSIIVLVGDHGEVWDENNQGHNKGNLEDPLHIDNIRVPVIFLGDNIPKNNLVENNIRTIDIVPTLMSLIKEDDFPNSFDGKDLSKFKEAPVSLECYSQIWSSDTAVITINMNNVKESDFEKLDPNSYLASSSLIVGKDRLVESYNQNGEVTKTRINTNKKLKSKLIGYNNITIEKINKTKNVSNKEKIDIAEQLKNLGYNV